MYLGEEVSDVEAVKGLIRKVVSRFHLPYFTLTPTFSVCPSHGYLRGRQDKCSQCGSDTEVYSRVVGYLRPVKQWNEGKQAEFSSRKTFRLETGEDWPLREPVGLAETAGCREETPVRVVGGNS